STAAAGLAGEDPPPSGWPAAAGRPRDGATIDGAGGEGASGPGRIGSWASPGAARTAGRAAEGTGGRPPPPAPRGRGTLAPPRRNAAAGGSFGELRHALVLGRIAHGQACRRIVLDAVGRDRITEAVLVERGQPLDDLGQIAGRDGHEELVIGDPSVAALGEAG